VDLYISTFGPVLSILSQNWPVLSAQTDESGNPLPIQTDVSLGLAREEVIALRKEELPVTPSQKEFAFAEEDE